MAQQTQNNGIGFIGLPTIVFSVLKLTGYIHWSWVWVLAPLWLATAALALVLLVVLIVALLHKK